MLELPFAKKGLGQHWLTDLTALQSIVEAAQVKAGDIVLEVGPGTGTLTDELVKVSAQVTAIEFDEQRLPDLKRKYHDQPLANILSGDIRTFDFAQLPADYKLVANIPYYLTSHLLRRLADANSKPYISALLIQKEVAERVAAGPGNMSQLSVFVQVYYEVTLGEIIPAYLFTPPPKVDSQVLVLTRRKQPLVPMSQQFIRVVKAGYSERRKKLRSSLSSGLSISKPAAEAALVAAKIPPDARAQELSLKQWHQLALAL